MGDIYPISFYIRKTLATASVLAFEKLAGKAAVEKARTYILQKKTIDEELVELDQDAMFSQNIRFYDIRVPVSGEVQDELETAAAHVSKYFNREEGIIRRFDEYLKHDQMHSDALDDYVIEYVYIGAVSVMVRGGFVNLLQAFLFVDPPIEGFLDQRIKMIGKNGKVEALKVLKAYKPAE